MTAQPPYPARCPYYTDTKAVQVTLRGRGKWHSRKSHTQIKEVKARKRTLNFVSPCARSPPSLRAGFKPQLSAYKLCSLPGSIYIQDTDALTNRPIHYLAHRRSTPRSEASTSRVRTLSPPSHALLLPQSLLLDKKRTQKSKHKQRRHRHHGPQRSNLITRPHLPGDSRRQLPNIIQTLPDPLLDAPRLVPVPQPRRQLRPQHLLQHRRADTNPDARPQAPEQVRARHHHRGVPGRGVGEQRHQRRRDARAAAEREQRHAAHHARRGAEVQRRDRGGYRDDHEAVGEHREGVVPALALHKVARADARRDGGDHGRHERRAREGGRGALHGLEEEWDEEDGGDVARDAEEVCEVAREEGAVKDDVARCERVRGDAHLDVDKDGEQDGRGGERGDGEPARPPVVRARIQAHEQGHDGGDEGSGAEEVDALHLFAPVRVVRLGHVEDKVHRQEREHAERDLAREGPAPADRVCEEAAEGRAGGGAGGEDDVEVPLPDAAVAERDDVAEKDGDDAVHAAAADAGYGAGDAELGEGLG
ncbi:hypothetical protein CNYM01_06218 [Colletotrichum nymphaeae SA-01]|uniref:Uncharacterized protein n=1 Tax=Colletotrichum nymphaeae SA-01 TaxID=1460502 RepID=A0A135SVQ9_9PEZI|nr:hypothetical protein CNYM01_06218 [Colletotrichum nymphaeae SA-01]